MPTLGEAIDRLLLSAGSVPTDVESVVGAARGVHASLRQYADDAGAGLDSLQAQAAAVNVSLERLAESTGNRASELREAARNHGQHCAQLEQTGARLRGVLEQESARPAESALGEALVALREDLRAVHTRQESLQDAWRHLEEGCGRLSQVLAQANRSVAALEAGLTAERTQNLQAAEAASQGVTGAGRGQLETLADFSRNGTASVAQHLEGVLEQVTRLAQATDSLGQRLPGELERGTGLLQEATQSLQDDGLRPLERALEDSDLPARHDRLVAASEALAQVPPLERLVGEARAVLARLGRSDG